jgi:hemerythrin superfamily protein
VSKPPTRRRGLLDHPTPEEHDMTQQPELFRILTRQHREVDAMLSQLATVEDGQIRSKLLPVLEQQLLAHAKAEEETLYRELAREGEKGEAKHAKREHRDIETALKELLALDVGDDGWDDALQHLTETVQHHVEEEEGDVFDAALRSLDPEKLDEVAAEFTERRRQQLEKLGGNDDDYADLNKDELLAEARERDLPGRSSMTRDELISHLRASD